MAKHTQSEQLPNIDIPPVRDLDRRNAFGRVPKADYFDIDLALFSEVTPQQLDAISPERAILPRLYGMHSGRSVDSIALNAVEYGAIVRSPGSFAVAVAAKTESARQLDNNVVRKEETVSRSVGHAFVSKADRAQKVISGLNEEGQSLHQLLKEIKAPGYAHMNEADMRILAETARTSFDNILDVVGHQAGWTPEQKERATLAFNARLFDPDYKKALSFWSYMTEVSVQYNQRKTKLFQSKLKAITAA